MPGISPYLQDQCCCFVSATQAWLDGREGSPSRAETPGQCGRACPREADSPEQELWAKSSQSVQWLREPAPSQPTLLSLSPAKSFGVTARGPGGARSWLQHLTLLRCGQHHSRVGEMLHILAPSCSSNTVCLLFSWGFDTKMLLCFALPQRLFKNDFFCSENLWHASKALGLGAFI